MRIYLVQHGKSASEEENPRKPLTFEGRNETLRVANAIARNGLEIKRILHSGKTRAEQTAQIFAEKLSVNEVEDTHGISPVDPPDEIASRLEDGMMIVGHMPHLSKLTSYLLHSPETIKFKNSAVLCLVEYPEGWKIEWYITPEMH